MEQRLIDADRLKENLLKNIGLTNGMERAFRETPTIDAEPVRHGKWKVTPVYIKCSECGESFMLIPQNYCPNCGARIDKYD